MSEELISLAANDNDPPPPAAEQLALGIPPPLSETCLVTSAAVSDNPYVSYMAGLAAGSRPAMLYSLRAVLRRFFSWHADDERFPWCRLRYAHLVALRSWLRDEFAPATGNRVLSAIRGILREAFRFGAISERDYRTAVDVAPVRGIRPAPGRAVSELELRMLFAACREAPTPALAARNAAMLALLYGAGLRRAELVALDVEHLNERNTRSVRVLGKGNKVRFVYLPDGAIDALVCWLIKRGGSDAGPLFWATKYKGTMLRAGKRISDDTVADVLDKLVKVSGVQKVTPHDLRRSYISDLLDAGVDVVTVARMVGHSQIVTTQRYDRRGDRAMEEAARRLRVPFRHHVRGRAERAARRAAGVSSRSRAALSSA